MDIVRLLTEEPVSKDELEGAHEQVADSLLQLISHSSSQPGMIALEGGLGSGKSTVLKILEEKIQPSSYEMFVFDCFKYQNGPIRNAFFEQFHDFVKTHSCSINHRKLSLLRLKATGRYEEKRGEDTFNVRWSTLVFVCLLPLSAASLLSIAKGAASGLPLSLLYILLGAPFLQILLGAIIPWFRPDTSLKTGAANSKKIIISTTEVTSSDLSKYYGKFLEELPDGKRVIIVLDNIDRLDSDALFNVWADMEIFSKNEGKPHWVIVPYDLDQLRHSFSQRYKPAEDCGIDNPIKKNSELTEEFINKWFPIRYRVPEVLLSDWKNYFSLKWLFVFPDSDQEEVGQVLLLYRRYKTARRDKTPRNIKHFINDVAVRWSSNADKAVSRLVIVAYQLFMNSDNVKNSDLLEIYSDEESSFEYGIRLIAIRDSEWQRNMAALHYNVQALKAEQIILQEPLEDSINSKDFDTCQKLLVIDGFYDCLEDLVQGNGADFFENSVICLNEIESSSDLRARQIVGRRLELMASFSVFKHPAGFCAALVSVLGAEAATPVLQRAFEQYKQELSGSSAEEFDDLLTNLDNLYPFVEPQKVNVAPALLADRWLISRELFPRLDISFFSSTFEVAQKRFNYILSALSDTKTAAAWSYGDFLELGISYPLYSHIDNKDSCFEMPEGGWAEWLPNVISNGENALALLALIVILYDKDTDYSPLFLELLENKGIDKFLPDEKGDITCALFALSLKNNCFNKYHSHYDDIEICNVSYNLKRLLNTSCSNLVLINQVENPQDYPVLAELIALSVKERWYGRIVDSIIRCYPRFKSIADTDCISNDELWEWIEIDSKGLQDKLSSMELNKLPVLFLDDGSKRDTLFGKDICSFLSGLLIEQDLDSDDWEGLLREALAVHKLAAKYLASNSINSSAFIEAVTAIYESELQVDETTVDFQFIFQCATALAYPDQRALTSKLRKAILAKVDTTTIANLEVLLIFVSDRSEIFGALDKGELEGFLNLLSIVIGSPEKYPLIFDKLMSNSSNLFRNIRNNFDSDYIERAKAIFEKVPLYSDNETKDNVKKLASVFGVKLEKPKKDTSSDKDSDANS
jgi:hypothetical protein